jgi:hypothetical protein
MKLDSAITKVNTTTVVLKTGVVLDIPAKRVDIYNDGKYSVASFQQIDKTDIDTMGVMNTYRNISQCHIMGTHSITIRLEDVLSMSYKQ